eukprot:6204174-Pleurochrysis_carterae.AAC.1
MLSPLGARRHHCLALLVSSAMHEIVHRCGADSILRASMSLSARTSCCARERTSDASLISLPTMKTISSALAHAKIVTCACRAQSVAHVNMWGPGRISSSMHRSASTSRPTRLRRSQDWQTATCATPSTRCRSDARAH